MTKPVALVTGGSRGIGAATCRLLARDGYHVIVHYNNSAGPAEKIAQEIDGEALKADLNHDNQIEAMFAEIKEKHGTIKVLVNNAGIAECEPALAVSKDVFTRTMQVNVWAPIFCTQLAKEIMPQGVIVYLSSVCAQRPTPGAVAYAASKAGIEAVIMSTARPLGPNIRVNGVAPGPTETDMMAKNFTDEDRDWIKGEFPMERPCEPEDIAEMIAFLVSDKAKNITGRTITVDAGSLVM